MADVTPRLAQLQPANVEELTRLRDAAWDAGDARGSSCAGALLAQRFGGLEALASRHLRRAPPKSTRRQGRRPWRTGPPRRCSTPRDRAYLAFTEQFSTSVEHISDEEVSALLEHASEQEVFDFAVALYVIEWRCAHVDRCASHADPNGASQ